MKTIKLNNTIINTDNIAYLSWEKKSAVGYDWRENWCFYIHFVGIQDPLVIRTFDEKEYLSWLKELGVEL